MQPIVTTRDGAVQGVSEGGIAVFKGIPYAAPPFGADRFAAPRRPEPWTGIRAADRFGPTAPMAPYTPPFDALIDDVQIPGQDCLTVNIWSPDLAGQAPVMVWIHGGAFTNGSGAIPGYDGTGFARDGVVLVTVNYRLGVEGFLHLPDTAANRGLLDQIAALTWVQDNIAAFGGDRSNVTVFGESAGAMSIGALLAAPQAAGLFRRAILQSGAAHHVHTPHTAALIRTRLAADLDIEPTAEAFAAVPMDRLLAAQKALETALAINPDPGIWGEVTANLMAFEPVIDGHVLPAHPLGLIADGAAADVDILIGTNTDEFRMFHTPTGVVDFADDALLYGALSGYGLPADQALAVYRAARPGAGAGELLEAVVTDWFFRMPAVALAENHAARAAAGTYMYEFAWQSPVMDGRLGACHVAEIGFVFDNLDQPGIDALAGTQPPQILADTMHAAWIAFATGGDPGWPAYDTEHRHTMRFDAGSEVVQDPHAEQRQLWHGRR